jgi:hypothetical protein
MTGHFKYYFDLLDVMQDRASARPTLNTDNLGDLELTAEQGEFLPKQNLQEVDGDIYEDANDDGIHDGVDEHVHAFPVNQPFDVQFAQLETPRVPNFAGNIPLAPVAPLIIPLAASVAPQRMFPSTDSDTATDDDDGKDANKKGKRSAPIIVDEDNGNKLKAKSHPQRVSKKKHAIDIAVDIDDEKKEDDDAANAGKAKAAPASGSVKKNNTKQSATKPVKKSKTADAMIADFHDDSSRSLQAAVEEKKQHNQKKEAAMEAAIQRRTDMREQSFLASQQQQKQKYEMTLYHDYRQLKTDRMTDEKIIMLFPDMKKYTTLD